MSAWEDFVFEQVHPEITVDDGGVFCAQFTHYVFGKPVFIYTIDIPKDKISAFIELGEAEPGHDFGNSVCMDHSEHHVITYDAYERSDYYREMNIEFHTMNCEFGQGDPFYRICPANYITDAFEDAAKAAISFYGLTEDEANELWEENESRREDLRYADDDE